MNQQEVIHNALNNIQINTNIKGKWKDFGDERNIDGEIELEIDNQTINLYADIKTEIRTAHLEKTEKKATEYHPFIVVAQKLFPKIKEELRKRNIAYLEANGNIYKRKNNFCVDRGQ